MLTLKIYHIIFSICLLFFLTHNESTQQTLTFCYRGPQCYQVNDHTFASKYKNQLNQLLTNITTLKIHQLKLSEQNYLRLFSHSMPKLKKLSFWNHDPQNVRNQFQVSNVLTPKVVEKIFRSKFFQNLEELDLSRTYIQFRHLQFLEQDVDIVSNLKMIYFVGTFMQERAFKLLERINFQGKLQTLGLAENSLISSNSIESILNIIQPQKDNAKSHLRNLTVYNTAITTDNMIRLLDNIDLSKMTNLNVAYNSFQHSKSFKIPFNNTFFQYLSKCKFRSLKRLSLGQMDLDHEQLPYLSKLQLPVLENLELSTNFITDQYFQQWITRQKMPRLKRLSINENNITDRAIQLLVDEKFENFTALYISNNRRLTSKHLVHLTKLNTSKITRLQMSHNTMFEKDLRMFFSKPFDSLLQLTMMLAYDGFQFFEFANWKSMQKLRFLNLIETDVSQSFHLINSRNITFPKLRTIRLGGAWITKDHIASILSNLKQFSPTLESISFQRSDLNPHTFYFNLTGLNPNNIPTGAFIITNGLTVYKSPQTNRLQIIDVVLGDSQGNIFWGTMFNYQFFGNYQESDPYFYMFFENITQIEIVTVYLKLCADWENLESLEMFQANDLTIFLALYFMESDQKALQYYEEFNNFVRYHIDFKPSVYFPYLRIINYIPTQASDIPTQPKFYYFLNKMRTPLLNTIQMGSESTDSFVPFLNKLLKQNRHIKNLFIMDSRVTCEMFQQIFLDVHLPYILQIILRNNQIELQCLQNVIGKHPTVKYLTLANNFLERGLFSQVIAQHQLLLKGLDISNIQIGNDEFAQLALINLQFLITLMAATIDINSEGIKMLVGNTTNGKLFPRCEDISLANNNINEGGVGVLLQTGMPFVKRILLFRVSNPNLFNQMFSYPNHFQLILIQDANIYGIDPELDPRSTRFIKIIQLKSPSLSLQDYEVLSGMSFLNLLVMVLLTQNINECEMLKYILQIVQNADQVQIHITNQKLKGKSLNDKCLKPSDPKQIYMKHLNAFNIIWGQELAYIPKFYTYFYSENQLVSALVLANSLISDEVLIEIVENCNLEHLWIAVLVNNLLTDKSIKKLFSLPLDQLKTLQLQQNEFTHKGLQGFDDKTFLELIGLDLSMNAIGDEGIELLTKAHFPKLLFLNLQNADITKQGLKKLSKLDAPQLTQLSLLNNLFDQHDFIQFCEEFQIDKFPLLMQIGTSMRINELNANRMKEIVKNKMMRDKMVITYDQYRLEMENKAEL